MRTRAWVLILSTLLVGSVFVQPSLGQKYPIKPIEFLCPYTPGGTSDLMTRLIADTAQKYLGQPAVVVNKPGASGSVAAADVITSKPDGYKLVSLPNAFFAATIYTQKVPFGPNDLTPIANFMEYKVGLIVKGDSPWKTFGALLDYAKKNPRKLRWAHMSRGSSLFMNTFLIFRKVGIEAIEVPYIGVSEILAALLGGHLDAAAITYGGIKDHVVAGSARFLISYTTQRWTEPPNVPTAVELGFPEAAQFRTFVGIYAHKDTPEEIKKTLFDAFKKTSEDPEFKKGFEAFGEGLFFAGPEFMKEAIQKSLEVGIPMLKEFGLYVGK